MSIDAISSVVAGVGSLAASRTELTAGNKGAIPVPPPAAAPVPSSQQGATVLNLSDEAGAQQQAAAEAAAKQQAAALAAEALDLAATAVSPGDVSAVTNAVSSAWSAGAPAVDNAAVQEALNALDEASRENSLQVQQDAITTQQDQGTQNQQAIDDATLQQDAVTAQQTQDERDQQAIADAATAAAQQQDDIVLAAVNSGVQLAYGSLATPITGDPALRQPGRVEIVA